MWGVVTEAFADLPAQREVAKLMLERGYRISEGRICSGEIRLPYTEVARELGVDRRVVDAAATTIQESEELRRIFERLESVAFLGEVAPVLGFGVVVIEAWDPAAKGLLGRVATAISGKGFSIHQAVADDPSLVDEPRLTVVTDERPSGELVEELTGIEGVAKVTVY